MNKKATTSPSRLGPENPVHDEAWYRQPILWLGAAIFVVSLAGCIWMIVLAMHNPDVPTHTPGRAVLGVPADAVPTTSRSTKP